MTKNIILQRIAEVKDSVAILKEVAEDISRQNLRDIEIIKGANCADYAEVRAVIKSWGAQRNALPNTIREITKGKIRMADLEEAIRQSKKDKRKDYVEGEEEPDGLSDFASGGVHSNADIQRKRRDQAGSSAIIQLLESQNPLKDLEQRFGQEGRAHGGDRKVIQTEYSERSGGTQSVGLKLNDAWEQRTDPYDPSAKRRGESDNEEEADSQ